jgi:hypothetical protein
MKYLLLLIMVVVFGCATFRSLSPPPDLVTALVIEQVLADKPEWSEAAQEIAKTILEQAGEMPSMDTLENLAYLEIDKRELLPVQQKLAYNMVKSIRVGIEEDLKAAGINDAMERSLRVLELVAWIAAF